MSGACAGDKPADDYGEYVIEVNDLAKPVVITQNVDLKINSSEQYVEDVLDDVTSRIGLAADNQGKYFIYPIKQKKE